MLTSQKLTEVIMDGYPGLSPLYRQQFDSVGVALFAGAMIWLLGGAIVYFAMYFKIVDRFVERAPRLLAHVCSLGFIFLIAVIMLWGTPKQWGNIPGFLDRIAAINKQDKLDWMQSRQLDTALVVLETHLASLGANPSFGDLELTGQRFGDNAKVALGNSRVVDAQMYSAQEMVGTAGGGLITGGLLNMIFSNALPVNLQTNGAIVPDLRGAQAIVITAECDQQYVRLVLPNHAWIILELELVRRRYCPDNSLAYSHRNLVVKNHLPLLAQDFEMILSKTDGGFTAAWGIMQDGIHSNQPLFINVSSLTNRIGDDTYFIHDFQAPRDRIPANVPTHMNFPGEVASVSVRRTVSAFF